MADQKPKHRPARSKLSSIADIRRRELARAALRTIEKYGVKGATVQRVSEEAGISQGLVHYHFKTKADLLEAAIKLTNQLITEEVLLRLRQAQTPHERVLSVLEANFSPEIFNKETAQAWASCSGEAAFNPRFARIMNLIERRLISNLAFDLCKIMAPGKARELARILTIMSDGIWLQAARCDGPLNRKVAVKPIWDVLELASLPAASLRREPSARRS